MSTKKPLNFIFCLIFLYFKTYLSKTKLFEEQFINVTEMADVLSGVF